MKGFYHIWAWRPSWSSDQHHVNKFSSGPPGQKSNALTTEPKSRLPDAVNTQKLCVICFMHQSFATTSSSRPGNSGNIYFSLSKTRIYARFCGDTYNQSSAKSPAQIPAGKCKLSRSVWAWNKTPAVPRHCGDSAGQNCSLARLCPHYPLPQGGRGCK